jgi:glycosyltransferase involved in cell wall biosynthesis
MPLRVLCITESGDRPTIASFIGMHRAGIAITVVCPENHPNHGVLVDAGVPVIDIRTRRNFDRDAIAALRAELVRGRYDILHTFNNKALSNALRACKGLPVKVVAYRGIVGNVSFLDPVSWVRYLNPRIDRIVCVAEAIRQFFLSMKPRFLRMPDKRPVTIHKGHSLDWYTAAPANLEVVGIPAGAFTVTCVANYRPRKGVELLVDALAMLPDDIPAHLLLVGHMDDKRLSKHIAQSPVASRIHRAGFREDAPSLTAASDVFCLPSTKREGLARAIIEAMAYGVAPVVTDCGGSPELVVDGQSGLVVPVRDAGALAEAIERLYRNPDLRQRLGKAARERIATDFHVEQTIRKTIELYESIATPQDGTHDPSGAEAEI